MYEWLLFIHLLGAVAMGFYLLMPFLAVKLGTLSGSALAGYTSSLYGLNRIAQFLLIVQLLTGGYLMGKSGFAHSWMAVALVLLIAIGAMSGMMGVNLKRLQQGATDEQGKDAASTYIGKIKIFSWVLAILFVVILALMEVRSLSW